MMAAVVSVDSPRRAKKFVKVMQPKRYNGQSSPHFMKKKTKASGNKNNPPQTAVTFVSLNLRQLQRPPKKFVKIMSQRYIGQSSPHFHRRKDGHSYANEKIIAESVHKHHSDSGQSVMARRRPLSDARIRLVGEIPETGDSTASESDLNDDNTTVMASNISGKKKERSKVQEKIHKESFCSVKIQMDKDGIFVSKEGVERSSTPSNSVGCTKGSTTATAAQKKIKDKKSSNSSDSKPKIFTLRSSSRTYNASSKSVNKKGPGFTHRGRAQKRDSMLQHNIDGTSHKNSERQRSSRRSKPDFLTPCPARRARSLSLKRVAKTPPEEGNKTSKHKRSKSLLSHRSSHNRSLHRCPQPAPLPSAALFTHRPAFSGNGRATKEFAAGLLRMVGVSTKHRTSHDSGKLPQSVTRCRQGNGDSKTFRKIATDYEVNGTAHSAMRDRRKRGATGAHDSLEKQESCKSRNNCKIDSDADSTQRGSKEKRSTRVHKRATKK